MKQRGLLCVLLAGVLAACPPAIAGAEKALVLGVHPFLPATRVLKKFSPLAAYLGGELGRPVRIEISRDYEDHIRRVGAGEVDIAYMGPASYVKLAEAHGRPPLLARLEVEGSPFFYGNIFVREDSAIRTLEELKGARFAFGSIDSTMGTIVPLYVLQQEGVPLEELGGYTFLDNHDNVAMGVLVGDFDAGAVKEETFGKYRAKGLRSLTITPPVSEHVFVASPGTSPEAAALLGEILLKAGEDEEGGRALRSIKRTVSGLVSVEDSDYDNLRTILGEIGSVKGLP